jgi:hypothetical protein
MSKPLVLTHHVHMRMAKRQLPVAWVERTIRHPDWAEPEPLAPSVECRFRAIPEFDGPILRIACVETASDIRIITVTFDRDARRKP